MLILNLNMTSYQKKLNLFWQNLSYTILKLKIQIELDIIVILFVE